MQQSIRIYMHVYLKGKCIIKTELQILSGTTGWDMEMLNRISTDRVFMAENNSSVIFLNKALS